MPHSQSWYRMTEFVWHEYTKAGCGHTPGHCTLYTIAIHSSYWNQPYTIIEWCVSNVLKFSKT